MKVLPAAIAEVLLIEPDLYGDRRGYFYESYNKQTYADNGLAFDFVQDNESMSIEAGTIRGLHYQLEPYAQTKLVRVLNGAIFDVAVDLRPGSPTFGQWTGEILSADNKRQLLIPKGFAHGFCTLEPNTQVAYKVDSWYSREHERGIRYDDPDIGIDWPTVNPILSDKDAASPYLHIVMIDERSVQYESAGYRRSGLYRE